MYSPSTLTMKMMRTSFELDDEERFNNRLLSNSSHSFAAGGLGRGPRYPVTTGGAAHAYRSHKWRLAQERNHSVAATSTFRPASSHLPPVSPPNKPETPFEAARFVATPRSQGGAGAGALS